MAKTIVGLDVGNSRLRAVEMTRSKNGTPTIIRAAEVDLPFDTVSAGAIKDSKTLVEALKDLWRIGKFSTKEVQVAMSSEAPLARRMIADWMPDSDFSKVINIIARNNLSFETDVYYFDYHTLNEFEVLEEDEESDETVTARKKEILLCGSLKVNIDALIEVLFEAKLKPVAIDAQGLSILRLTKDLTPDNGVDIDIDLGADVANLAFHIKGQPIYIRTLGHITGNAITAAVADTLNIQGAATNRLTKAEEKKLKVLGLGTELTAQRASTGEIRSVFGTDDHIENQKVGRVKITPEMLEISAVITEQMSSLVTNIRETIENYMNDRPETFINSFTLSGGLAGTPNIAERLSAEFKTKVKLATPISDFSGEKTSISQDILTRQHEYSTAVGLSLGNGAGHE